MKKELFNLKRFKMKDNQDIELGYRYNGKMYEKVTFSQPVHPDLANRFGQLTEVFTTITGMTPEANDKIVDVDVRGVHIFDSSENVNFMVSAVVEFKGGAKGNVNTPKYSCDLYTEVFRTSETQVSIDELIKSIADEVFELVNNHKSAQLQMFTADEQGSETDPE